MLMPALVRGLCPPLSFPPSLAKSSQSHGKAAAVHPHSTLAAESRFWDADVRKKLVAPKYSKVQLDERRAKVRCEATRNFLRPVIRERCR